MKKHLFFLFAALTLLTAPGAMRAQTTVTIGNESSTGSAYIMPVNMYYNYSLTQQIYRADEINMPDGGTITSISFEYLYSGAFSLSGIKVFMKNTTKENFTNNNDWVEVSASDKVFEGTFSASGAGWVTLTLNTPFHYDGMSNLLVCFYDPTNGYPGNSYKFRTTSTTSDYPDQYLALTCNSDSYVPDPDDLYSYSGAKGLQTIRNNIRLTINPDITEVFVNDVTLPTWGEHPDYDWSVPSGANYYINATESKWQDATTSGNLFSGNVFNQMGHDYVLKLQFESIYGWHISNNVAVYLNDDPSLIASTAFNTSGRLVAQTIPFNVYPYDVVNIGDGTSTSYYAPYNSFWGYSFVEQIYTADEIAMPAGGAVTSISFNMQSSEQQTNHITVYMKNVSRSAFDNSNDYETVTSSDIVFEGDYTFVQGWNTITLDVPFLYNGTDNLMIAFHENTPGYSTLYFSGTYKEGSVLSAHSDTQDPDPYDLASFTGSKYIQNARADIQIAFVEPIVEIGSGNGSSNYLPTYTFYKYSLTEQIYTAAEIGQAGDIYTISFYNTNDAGTRDLDIYMTVSDKNTFSGPTNWTGGAPSNLVFSGEVDFEADGWTTIELSNPFYYPGVYNIVLTVDDNTGYYDHSRYFKTFDATGQALRISSDATDYDPWYTSSYNGTVLDVKNQIRFGFAPVTCTAPTNLTVSNIGSVGAGVSWDQSGDSDHWIVQCSANSDFSTASEVSVGSPYWYIYSLNPNTTYFVRVANDCGSGNISSWSNTVTFTTTESPCHAPTDLTVSNISYNGADLTWDQPDGGSIWRIEYSTDPEFTSAIVENSFDPYWSLTGLDPITTYYVRVANDCGTLGNSEWATTSFTTTGGIIIVSDIIDFEPGDFSQYPFDNDATYPWIIVDASDGCDNGSTYCMMSGNAGVQSSTSTIEATYDYPDAGYITFDAKCMGEGTNWDVCKFFIDGVLQFSYGEYMAGWNHYSYIVPAGTHTFTWSYTKDSSEDPDGDGFFVDNIEFGIGMPCLTPPIDLTAYNITDNSVDVSWTGSGEAYTVKYRPVLLFDDFENGLSQWTQIDADGDGNGWLLGSDLSDDYFTHSGTDLVLSKSYDNTAGVALTPDNYLVSPQFSLGGIVEFWAKPRNSSWLSEHFSIAVSTTGNTDPADFQTVPGAEWTLSADEWQQFIVDLSAYAGEQGYVALRHHDCSDMFYLDVDDFIIYAPGEWQTVTTTSNNTVITGLDPETQYIFQVQNDCGSDGTSEWSELMSFTTTNVTCSAPTNLIVTDVTENIASLSWTGPSDGIEWDLWYSTTSDFATFGHEIVDATTWTLEGLTAGTTYYARVRTFCGTMGNSEWSNTVTFTTSAEGPTTVVEIGSGTATNTQLPSYSYYNYGLSEQIYTAAEIGQAGIINSVSFYNDGATKTRTYDMYLMHTSKTAFSDENDWVAVTASDLVFSGSVTMTSGEWTTFVLTTPFAYNGTSNLLLVMDDNTGGYTLSPHMACRVFDATDQALSVYSDDEGFDPYYPESYYGDLWGVKNQIQLGIVPIPCPAPTNLTYSNLTANSVNLDWTATDGYEWYIRYSTVPDFSTYVGEYVTTHPWTLTGLTPETTYYVQVQSNCGSGLSSVFSSPMTFTTLSSETPSELTVYDATATNGYVPVYGFYADAYLKAEYIMNASELTDMTNRYISRMTFYATNPPEDIWDPASFKVFLKEVSFTTLDEYTGYGDATVVYEGSLYVVDDKMVVDFNTPYFYEGGNLLVGFYNTVPGNYWSCTWAGMTVDGASVQGYSYSSLDQISVNQRNFVPKTTFRYALSPALCPTPNNLTFANVLINSAELSWNERGSASDWVVEYGTTADFSDATSINVSGVPEYTLIGLTPETTYYVRVSSLCGPTEMSDWSVVKSFTTPEQCPTPTDIEVEPGSNRVTITWNGGNNSSDFGEFKVRKAGYYADTLFFDGFENGLDQWTVYVEGDASHNGWLQVDPRTYLYNGANYMDRTPYRGDYVAYASSYDGSSFDADNWLVTPQLELQGVVNFWVENRASNYLDSYEVLLSTGSNSPSDFTVTLQAMTQPSTEWSEVTLDLSAYAGQQGYIAIRQSSYDMEGILLDNFGIYNNYQEPSAWLTGVTAYSPATFEEAFYSNFMAESMPIEPETKYDFMIMEQCDGGGRCLIWQQQRLDGDSLLRHLPVRGDSSHCGNNH